MVEYLQGLLRQPMVMIQIMTVGLGLIILLLTLEMIRRDLLRTAYALIWLLTGIAVAIVGFWPDFFLNRLIQLTGMDRQTAMLFVVFGFMLVLLMQYSIIISRVSNRTKHLAQDLAILRQQLTEHLEDDHQQSHREPAASSTRADRVKAEP